MSSTSSNSTITTYRQDRTSGAARAAAGRSLHAVRLHRLQHRRRDRGRSRRPQRLCLQPRPRQHRRVRHRSGQGHARRRGSGCRPRAACRASSASIPRSVSSMSPTRAAIRSSATGSGATASCRRRPIRVKVGSPACIVFSWSVLDERQDLRLRDPVGACRRRPRSDDRRAGAADLPDHGLCVRGCRPRRRAVQPADRGLHLFAADQPDQRGARDAARHPGRRPRLHRRLLRPCRAGAGAVPADVAGRGDRRLLAALRRLAAADAQHLSEVRLEGEDRRCRRCRRISSAPSPTTPRRSSSRAWPIPAASISDIEAIAQHRRGRRRAAAGRQHAGHALALQADRLRRHPDHAFDHQVPERQRHLDGRRGRRFRQVRLGEGRQVPEPRRARARLSRAELLRDLRRHGLHLPQPCRRPARPRPQPGAVQRLAHHAGHRDAGAAHGAPLRQCPEGRRISRRSIRRWRG